jgi:putative Mg2+ transporter-C (MgtC) family protein
VSLSTPDFWIAIVVAAVCGTVIGLERQIRGKPAGIRTSILICLGTVVFIRLGVMLQGDEPNATRVLGQVVTGVGFIGAGVMLAREGLVRGVTSAAVIWILAGIGATIGFGWYWPALALSVITVAVLVGVMMLERRVVGLRRGEYDENAPERVEERTRLERTETRGLSGGNGP